MPLPRADLLAIERTVLANERTFLAYFRTAAALLTSGVAILQLEFFAPMRDFSLALLLGAPVVLAIGVWRFFVVRRKLTGFAQESLDLAKS
jgi:putative membrane protein